MFWHILWASPRNLYAMQARLRPATGSGRLGVGEAFRQRFEGWPAVGAWCWLNSWRNSPG